jgi:2-keto-4-pentenoate hydratase/2-oxohepta-3-ene-1,7-dioic acid hydratase in catechol pathway
VRLYRYTDLAGGFQPRIAVAMGNGAPVDLIGSWEAAGHDDPDLLTGQWLTSSLLLIEEGPQLWQLIAEAVRAASKEFIVDPHAEGFRWLCPLDRAASLRDFLSFESHVLRGAERRDSKVPEYWYVAPVYYKGNHRAIIGPDDECEWPRFTSKLDFELELAMIVGVGGRDISPETAGRHIFGFTVMNDFSARDIQAREMSAWLGPAKGKDFATALGPCIVTTDEVGVEPDLDMVCRVNGEEWGRARSGEAHWKWADMLGHVSRGEDVYPGDVYGSGTPGGCCGLDLGRELEPGDLVELEIEGIGLLRNPVGRPPTP